MKLKHSLYILRFFSLFGDQLDHAGQADDDRTFTTSLNLKECVTIPSLRDCTTVRVLGYIAFEIIPFPKRSELFVWFVITRMLS
jgi:hypothetical protein